MSPRFARSAAGEQHSIPLLDLGQCLAKSHPNEETAPRVREHCRLVGKIAESLLRRLPAPVRKVLPAGCVSLAALHDVGKVSPGFQKQIWDKKLPELSPELYNQGGFEQNHALISEVALRDWYRQHAPTAADWATVVGLHHGLPCNAFKQHDANIFGGNSWASLRVRLLEELTKEFGPPPCCPVPDSFTFVTGFVCVADWIASDEELFPPERPLEEHLERIEEVLDRLGFLWPEPRPGLTFQEIFGFCPNDIQAKTYQLADQPGLLLVEAPMGTGKTEAALWAAYRLMVTGQNHGLYFALPTRLSSNLIHHRVEGFLGKIFGEAMVARLIHGQAWLQEYFRRHWEPAKGDQSVDPSISPRSEEDPLRWMLAGGEEFRPSGSWFTPAKRGLLWPFGVGTVDQALLGVVQVRHFFMRLFGLAGKVVILDEIHSYDFYTGTLIEALIRRLRDLGSSVILLSGTLTTARRESLGIKLDGPHQTAYPVVSRGDGRCGIPELSPTVAKTVKLWRVSPQDAGFWQDLETCLRQKAAIIWVCNTVARAQEIFRRAKGYLPEGLADVELLHSLFLPWQRYEKESRWANRLGRDSNVRGPSLLVATQVVEQSVDLDADLLITELAPTDMLLQRIGRLWRHQRKERPSSQPECWIIDSNCLEAADASQFRQVLGGSAKVYAPYVLYRTARLLAARDFLDFPWDVRSLLEATYQDPQADDPPWVTELFTDLDAARKELRDLALAAQDRSLPALRDEENVVTRYSDIPTHPLLIVKNIIDRGGEIHVELLDNPQPVVCPKKGWSLAAAARLHLNVLSVPDWYLRGIPSKTMPGELAKYLEKSIHVLSWTETGELVYDSRDRSTPLRYSKELGLYIAESERRCTDDEL